jgi:hypothetical protein
MRSSNEFKFVPCLLHATQNKAVVSLRRESYRPDAVKSYCKGKLKWN